MTNKINTSSVYHFADHGNACVINETNTPRHWYNYLWNENRYCAQISQTGHGRSYYLSEKAEMCMINQQDARYIYLRDDDTNECWNIGQGPLNTPVTNYSCTHHIGYTKIQSSYKGIEQSWRLFVPQDGYQEVWTVAVENTTKEAKNLSMFSAVSFYLEGFKYPRYYEMYRCMHSFYDTDLQGMYCESSHPFAPHARYNGFLAASEPAYAYDGDLAKFCGTTSTITQLDASACALFQRPDIVTSGKDCSNSEATLFILGGVLQHKILLQPGERKTLHFVFGISESSDEARNVMKHFSDTNTVEAELQKAIAHYEEKYSSLSVTTPDEKINYIMNNWIKKQVDFCIVGKKGVRDNLQIAVALLNYRQEKAKEEILECLRHQFKDGHAVLTWYPYDDTRYSDQPFWIIWAVCQLIKETGDFSILDQAIEWQDGGEASVLDHVKAAVLRLIQDKGRNGLVRIYFADWNDALNITTDPEAESVMLSHQFCLALKELSALMKETGDSDYAAWLEHEYCVLRDSINTHAWDGAWYRRALSSVENIGSKDSFGSTIYLNAQTWAVLGDVTDEEKLPFVIKAVDGMEHDFGFPLNLPAYPHYSPNVGRMSGMLPGLFENGGVYCHATGFKILMDCKLGRGNKAVETLKKIMPDSKWNPSMQSGAEPYVFTNCYSTNPGYYGKSYQSWTTGTSAWAMMGLYEGIMGIKRDYKGLRLTPCFPQDWTHAEMTRHFRNADYHITIDNPNHLEEGTLIVTVDGKTWTEELLPNFQDQRLHEVHVKIQ